MGPNFVNGRRAAWLAALAGVAALAGYPAPAAALTYRQQTVMSGIPHVEQIAVAPAGDVLAVSADNASSAANTAAFYDESLGQVQTTSEFLTGADGIAENSAGTVYIDGASGAGGSVYETSVGGGALDLLSGFGTPGGLAVDAKGDLFIVVQQDPSGDLDSGEVVELPAGASNTKTIASGLSYPQGVAVDAAGDVFYASFSDDAGDPHSGYLAEIPAGGGTTTHPIPSLSNPEGVAVDPAGDVFVMSNSDPQGDPDSGEVIELTAAGHEIPIATGIAAGAGVAVDSLGDVFYSSYGSGWVVELTPTVPSGSLAISPGSAPAGSQVAVASVTPCPLNAPFPSTKVTVTMTPAAGGPVVTQANTTPDGSGDWEATLTVPANVANGAYYIGGMCSYAGRPVTQDYAQAPLIVGPVSTAGQGPQGVQGPQGNAGVQGAQGVVGPQGVQGPSAPAPSGYTSKCSALRGVTTCVITYTYPTSKLAATDTRAEAVANVRGRARVIATGRLHGRKLVLTYKRLHRGRYRVTLLALPVHHAPVVLGHTSLTVS